MLISLVRVKVLALLLGPAGVGVMGLMMNLMTTTSQLMGLGIGSSGTKEIGASVGRQDTQRLDTVRRALFWGTMTLGSLGGASMFLLREVIAERLFGDPIMANAVGWLAMGVALSVGASAQTALIAGMGQIKAVAKVQVVAGLISTVAGLAFVWALGMDGVIFHVIATPVTTFLFGHYFVAKLPRDFTGESSLNAVATEFKALAALGFSMMVSALVTSLSVLLVRSFVQREVSAEALGYFQAAWGLSMMYLSFVLAVLGTDFYPKLAGMFHDKAQVSSFINEQTKLALLMSAPFMLVLMGFLPWIVPLLYSSEFDSAVDILRWMIIADVIKIATFPLRFVIIVAGRGAVFIITELSSAMVFVLFAWLLIKYFGVEAVGLAYLARYIVYLPIIYYFARTLSGLRFNASVVTLFLSLLAALTCLFLFSSYGDATSAVFCVAMLCVFCGGVYLRSSRRPQPNSIGNTMRRFF